MCNYVPSGNQPDDQYLGVQIQRCPEEAAAYLAAECRMRDKTIETLHGNARELRAEADRLEENLAAYMEENVTLREELASLRSFKRSVDEALNSGDGSYRP